MNCWVAPKGIEGVTGARVIDTNIAVDVTVRLAVPLIVPTFAVIVLNPIPTPLAKPWLPAASLMVATPSAEEVQSAVVVRFCVLPSV